MYQRVMKPSLQRLATQYPVVTMTGPRQAGKTTLCQHTFPKHAYVNLEDLSLRNHAIQDPKGFLAQYKSGVILDEIQRAPDLPSYIQPLIDQNQAPGQFILTGSQQLEVTNTINQSLAGRSATLNLLPLSTIETPQWIQTESLDNVLYTGFYPRILEKKLEPTEALGFYLSTYIERDLRQLIHLKDLQTFERFLKLCAGQIGQLTNFSRLANDCGISQNTVKSWLSLLQASYIIFFVQPHFENFRKRLTKSPKLYFHDVGLAAYLLDINKAEHIKQHPLRGALFENLIVSEFLKNRYNHVKKSNLYFFRDHVGNEVDLILDYGHELVSVEIKSGASFHSEYFSGLNYYQKLAGTKNTRRILIYSGETVTSGSETSIYSYKDLAGLFSKLNE